MATNSEGASEASPAQSHLPVPSVDERPATKKSISGDDGETQNEVVPASADIRQSNDDGDRHADEADAKANAASSTEQNNATAAVHSDQHDNNANSIPTSRHHDQNSNPSSRSTGVSSGLGADDATAARPANELFVSNLAWQTKAEHLQQFFTRWGALTEYRIVMDNNTQQSRGFGFVAFQEDSSMQACLNDYMEQSDNQWMLDGRRIGVKPALDKHQQVITAVTMTIDKHDSDRELTC